MHLIPAVKQLKITEGYLADKSIHLISETIDSRLIKGLKKLKLSEKGTPLSVSISGVSGEGYQLDITEQEIRISAEGPAGAFYAIQTLRQVFKEKQVPCLHIEDAPDFAYRGFYQDVTRGKIPTVETIKRLIDTMAYYKLNSLQLYVEHVFEFEETKELWENAGYLTGDELREIGEYCKENFIEFIPSLSTFGHMCELLNQKQYRHLRVLKDYPDSVNFWWDRMSHHTIDPLQEESFELVKSLINQYAPQFESDMFNICCDETFDLTRYAEEGYEVGALYLSFTKKIIAYVQSLGKKVMMWGDVLLDHPEIITEFPEDVTFLNWYYDTNVQEMEEKIAKFAGLHRRQIVCPGTTAWNRFCERVETEEINIVKMTELGHKYGAEGVLNTNWGDWGNPESLELCMYGLVLGAEKSWSVDTKINEVFYKAVNVLLYESKIGVETLKKLSCLNDGITWWDVCCNYFKHRYQTGETLDIPSREQIAAVQNGYLELLKDINGAAWSNGAEEHEGNRRKEYREELLLAAEAICLMAELSGKLAGYEIPRMVSTQDWLNRYRQKWLQKNKPSELRKIEELFTYYENAE